MFNVAGYRNERDTQKFRKDRHAISHQAKTKFYFNVRAMATENISNQKVS